MNPTLSPENYVFRFGKFKNTKAIDVAKITEVDKFDNFFPGVV